MRMENPENHGYNFPFLTQYLFHCKYAHTTGEFYFNLLIFGYEPEQNILSFSILRKTS